jgi:radical SAM protein with 4Fe4S-binding SPASM domain
MPRGAELSLSEKIHVLDELAFNDVPALVFSGGEPLLAKDFWPVLGQARARGFHVSVTTNGTLLSREVVARLAETGVAHVEVSIDAASPREHDEFRGQPGYWVQAVEGLKNLVADGRLGTGLACTVTTGNLDRLDDIIQMSRELGAGIFHVLDFVPTGRGRDVPELDLAPRQRQRMLEILARHLDAGLAVVATAPQFGPGGRQRDELGRRLAAVPCGAAAPDAAPVPARYLSGCGAGHSVLAIQPNGDITPCLFLPIVVGNLRQHHIRNLWRQSEILHLLRERAALRGRCGVCDGKAACGGCRARAYACTGDIMAADPGCILNVPSEPPSAAPDRELLGRFPAAAESLVEGH